MSTMKEIHNYVKKNYESGNYDDAKAAYSSWKTEKSQQANMTDFEMGVQKAQSDYNRKGSFSTYPKLTMNMFNKLFDDKAFEISEFIRGYNFVKEQFVKK